MPVPDPESEHPATPSEPSHSPQWIRVAIWSAVASWLAIAVVLSGIVAAYYGINPFSFVTQRGTIAETSGPPATEEQFVNNV
jgi:hypothetical protein